ncbi:ubiquitin carboxyl-terminal hydrolase MINDY-2-like isoform X1 [Argonauta hians]
MDDQLTSVDGGEAQTNTTESLRSATTSGPFSKVEDSSAASGVVTNARDSVISKYDDNDRHCRVSRSDVTSNNTTSCMLSNTIASTTAVSSSTFTASHITTTSPSCEDHRLSGCSNQGENNNDVSDKKLLVSEGLMQPTLEFNKALVKNVSAVSSNKQENSNVGDQSGSVYSDADNLTLAVQQGKREHSRERQQAVIESDNNIVKQNLSQISDARMEESNNIERQLSQTTCPQALPLEPIAVSGDHQQSETTSDGHQDNASDETFNKVSSKPEQSDNQPTAAILTAATLSSTENTVYNSSKIGFMDTSDSPSKEISPNKITNCDGNTSDAKDSLHFDNFNSDNIPESVNKSLIDKNSMCSSQMRNNSRSLSPNPSSIELPLGNVIHGGKSNLLSSTDLPTEQTPPYNTTSNIGANTYIQQQQNNSDVSNNEAYGITVELSENNNNASATPASSEVPKRSERVISKTNSPLADSCKDLDDHLSKRSDTDSQDITPSESMSIPSDKDIDGIPLETVDNENGQSLSKSTRDGTSSSSSSVQSVYHLKWIHFQSQKVPIITQNENGPCPLLAIMNVLLLQGRVTLEASSELITSEQLMDHIGDCILQNVPKTAPEDVRLNYQQNMQDGMAVVHKLQTGLDVNVGFKGVQDFEYTPEYIIFELLGISLYHGWLVDPQSQEVVSAIGKCSYNQLADKIIVQKNSDNNEKITEALIAENFLEKTASQLTYHGLCELNTTVKEGELCVFFRNNHFSTLYGHKNELFLLVTDQGFLNESNVVWETLSSVEGDCYFVDTSFHTYTKPDSASSPAVVTPPIGSDQQIDQDYLVALSLDREQKSQRDAWSNQTSGLANSDVFEQGHHPPLSDLELAKKLQEEEDQRASVAAAQSNRRARTGAGPSSTSLSSAAAGRRSRDGEKDKDSCIIL